MNGDPYSRMVNAMRRQGKYFNEQPVDKAEVTGVNPITLLYNQVPITTNIVCSMPQADIKMLDVISREEYISNELKSFLTDIYNTLNIKVGDMVIVQKVGNGIYILGRA